MPGESSSSASDRAPTSVALNAFEVAVESGDSESSKEDQGPIARVRRVDTGQENARVQQSATGRAQTQRDVKCAPANKDAPEHSHHPLCRTGNKMFPDSPCANRSWQGRAGLMDFVCAN